MRVRSIQSFTFAVYGVTEHRTDSRSPLLRWHVSRIPVTAQQVAKHTRSAGKVYRVMDRSRTAYCIVKEEEETFKRSIENSLCSGHCSFRLRIVLIKPVDVSIRILEVGQPTDRGDRHLWNDDQTAGSLPRRIAASISGTSMELTIGWLGSVCITAPLIPDLRRYR